MSLRLYIVRWGRPPHVTSPTWDSPPSCKQALKGEQVEQKSVLKFSNKSPVRKSTTRFQCARKHARRVIYKLNKFPLHKGTANDYERHPFLVTIEKEKVLPQRSQR